VEAPRVNLQLDLPHDGATRTLIAVIRAGTNLEPGEMVPEFLCEPWLAELRAAAAKVDVTIDDPVTMVVERIDKAGIWCRVHGKAATAQPQPCGAAAD
jgi:hypothetical protein